MSASYERPSTGGDGVLGGQITSPEPDVVQIDAKLQVKDGNVALLQAETGAVKVDGAFQVRQLLLDDPTYIVDPLVTLETHGPSTYVADLRPVSSESNIGKASSPFYDAHVTYVYCDNVVTPNTNLTAIGQTVGNIVASVANLDSSYETLKEEQKTHTHQLEILSNVTTNQSTIPGISTLFTGDVYASSFKRIGGTSDQYLMADGSVLQASGTNSNATMHFFKVEYGTTEPPGSGNIKFNTTSNPSATKIWISHLTSDGVDVDAFLQLITNLSVIFIQDSSLSDNYVKYKAVSRVVGPTYTTVTVVYLESAGTGSSQFPNNHDVFLAVFSNNVAIDGRLSALEQKTAGIAFENNEAGELRLKLYCVDMQDQTIQRLHDPIYDQDAATKKWVEDKKYQTESGLLHSVGSLIGNGLSASATAAAIGEGSALVAAGGVGALTGLIGNKIDNSVAVATFFFKDGSKEMEGNLRMGNNEIKDVTTITATSFKHATGQSTDFLKGNGTLDSTTSTVVADVNSKTQNMSSINKETSIVGKTTCASYVSTENWVRTGSFLANSTGLIDKTVGAQFTLSSTVQVTQLYIPSIHYTDSGPRSFKFWKLNESTTFYDTFSLTYSVTKTTETGGNFVYTVSPTFTLVPGTYRYGVYLPSGSKHYENQALVYPAFTFDSTLFTNVKAVYTQFSTGFAVPDTIYFDGAPATGGFTFQITRPSSIVSDAFVRTGGGSPTEFVKSNGTFDTNTYLTTSTAASTYQPFGTQTPYGVPYYTSDNKISGATRDLFLFSGTIQTLINNATVGSCIRLATGAWTENLICSGQNYTLCGAPCPTYAQTTQITGNLQIGASSPGSTQTRVRVKDIKFIGNLSFVSNSTYQELRTYIDNCDFSGTITFPSTVATISGGTQIFFTNCSFSGTNNPLMTIPDQSLYSIYFTRCTFASQPITNNLSAGNFSRLIFSDCGTLSTLTISNCVFNGLNGSATSTSVTTNSLTLGGPVSAFLMGNGSMTAPFTSNSFTQTFTGGTGGTTSNVTINYKYLSIPGGGGTIVWLQFPTFSVTIGSTEQAVKTTGTLTMPSAIQPSNTPFMPMCCSFSGTNPASSSAIQTGWLQIFGGTGTMWIIPNNRGNCTVGSTAGINQPSIVTYIF